MTKTLSLGGDAKDLLQLLFQIISSTNTDPLLHLSEIIQNEMDADASEITITFYRHEQKRKGTLEKIVIEGNGFGFLESFEHYSMHIGDSIKKKCNEYLDRASLGLSRGQFCIGIQGFRAVCDEIQVINKTKNDQHPSTKDGRTFDDPDFSKMFQNRKMILKSNTLDVTIFEEKDFSDYRKDYGVTCILIRPKVDINSSNLVKFLSQNKRAALLADRNLKISVIDGSFEEIVKPIKYIGEPLIIELGHPKESKDFKYRGLGKVKATLYFHEPKPGSKIRLDVKKEPVVFDITQLQEFQGPPWNSDTLEGIIEYDLLEKSPIRTGVARDGIFWPAFLDIMDELTKKVEEKVKEYEEKAKTRKDEELMAKLERVYGEVKRLLGFTTWFDKPIENIKLGPLDHIEVFPAEVANVPALTTSKLYVRAYDKDGNVLKEKDSIEFKWNVNNDLGTIIPKQNGEVIFKAGSKIGPSTLEVQVHDLKIDKSLTSKIEIAITYPKPMGGKLTVVKIEPMFCKIAVGSEKGFKAVAEDEDRNIITRGVTYYWSVPIDETTGASFNVNEGEYVILKSGNNQGAVKLQVIATQNGNKATDFAMITVVEKEKKRGKKPKPKDTGLPTPDWYSGADEFPLRHSYLTKDGMKLYINDGHPDYKQASIAGPTRRQKYIAYLYAKELAKKECEVTGSTDIGEKILDVLSKIDRFWY